MKLAINIALLPNKNSYDKLVEINMELKNPTKKLSLGKDAVPHITLTHAIVEKTKLADLYLSLGNIALHTKKTELTVSEIYSGPLTEAIWLKIECSEKIVKLHETVLGHLGEFLEYEGATPEMFVGNGRFEKEAEWIRNFPIESSHKNYRPHITIGYGIPQIETPFTLYFDKLAIYQLGKNGTCAKGLITYEL